MTALARPTNGRMIGGVCAALARRFGTSATTMRVIFVVSCLLPGPQFLLYIALWILLPSEKKAGRTPPGDRTRTTRRARRWGAPPVTGCAPSARVAGCGQPSGMPFTGRPCVGRPCSGQATEQTGDRRGRALGQPASRRQAAAAATPAPTAL